MDHVQTQPSASQDYKKVPIAVFADGTVVGDSTKIVDKVAGSEVWPPLRGPVGMGGDDDSYG